MKPANNAPVYASIYAEVAEICRKHGYALAIHGSLARDFDIIGIPWVDEPSTPMEVIKAISEKLAIEPVHEPEIRAHGRFVHTITVGWGESFLDISFMPTLPLRLRDRVKDHEVARIVNNLTTNIGFVWKDSPQSLREIISKAVKGALSE